MLVHLEARLSCRRRCRSGNDHSSMSRPFLTPLLCRRRRLQASSVCMSLDNRTYPILRDTNQTRSCRWLHTSRNCGACLPFQRWRTFHSGNTHSSMNGRRQPMRLRRRHTPPHLPSLGGTSPHTCRSRRNHLYTTTTRTRHSSSKGAESVSYRHDTCRNFGDRICMTVGPMGR